MEGDTPDFHVFQFSFLDESLPEWKTKLGVSDTDPVSYAIALGVHVATKRIGLFESEKKIKAITHFSSLHSL